MTNKNHIKKWKMQDYKKVKTNHMVKKTENGINSYSDSRHVELTNVRQRLQEIYQITMPLRKETYNLRIRHEEIIAELTGVKFGN